ncbi:MULTISPECIES: flagellar hook-associated family protein [unclassified Pseudovibrio]|uniref:flagellar hook-associated family protein n=1 Tax=unclassified Pseudovibrio TaxID=2627060 RepID=UPI0007B19C36|nr:MULTISPECIES: flagellar hook-associated family protein [unclassified Pseudovibrio]KZK94844.1 flagellar hook-associated protein FlgL [Pseudovibrio sp. W74]KZL08589.1 flagellar hook-associated protein FlgL [Pseudovibrio sp. Ad14]KZL11431.1 flagellar hook-associated protein FlgL [Pseudovibrio sp. Ad26]
MVYSVSTLSSSLRLSDYLIDQRARLDKAVIENASKKHADMGLTLGAQTGAAASFRSEFYQLESQLDTNRQLVTRLDVMDTALDNMHNSASTFRSDLIALKSNSNNLKTASNLAYTELDKLTNSLNTNVSGVFVFGGINTGTAPATDFQFKSPGAPVPLGPEEQIEKVFDDYFGYGIDDPATASIPASGDPLGKDWETFLESPAFKDIFGADWTTHWSSATDEKMTSTIENGVTTTGSGSANEKAFGELAEGLSIVAVFGKLDLNVEAEKFITDRAVNSLNGGVDKTIAIEAQNGAIKTNVERTNSDVIAKRDVLNVRINDLENVDENRAAVELSLAQTQLEATYAITAKIKDLNILKYL